MIVPGKHLKHDRSLLGIGGEILMVLAEPISVSELWSRVKENREKAANPLSFDWFIMALSFLYAVKAVEYSENPLLVRKSE